MRAILATLLPLVWAWEMYSYPPIQVFVTFDNMTQVYDCFPWRQGDDPSVTVRLNLPDGVAAYSCQLGLRYETLPLNNQVRGA